MPAESWSGKYVLGGSGWLQWIALVSLGLAIAAPRLLALGRPVTPDEHLWLTRSANYLTALAQGELAWTYQAEHPGVTTMWAGAAGFLITYPQYLSNNPGQADPNEFHRYLRKVKDASPLQLLVAGRFFTVLGHTLILLASFVYARRFLGVLPALVSFLLLAFDPFHTALSRLLHLDGMLSNLLLLSLLAFLHYLERRRPGDLIVSAIAAGLGMLTKTPAILMLPVAGILAVYAAWVDQGSQPVKSFAVLVRSTTPIMAAWAFVAAITFVILWPAMWVRPIQTLSDMFEGSAAHLSASQGVAPTPEDEIAQGTDSELNPWAFYPISYMWRSTPIALAGLAAAGLAFFRRHSILHSPSNRLLLLGLLLFVLVFTVGMSASGMRFDRYLLPVYAPLDIIAGLGWWALGLEVGKRWSSGLLRYSPHAIALLVLALQACFTLGAYPYYLAYYNPLLGGGTGAQKTMPIGWGEGLDQAAQYLNKKPSVGQLEVISYFASGCFSYYFEGRVREFPISGELSEDDWRKFIQSDYAVIYISQIQRNYPQAVLEYVSHLDPEHTIRINGLEYARIYKLH